jgi:Holliday junction resolvase RusA-like endonuclease
MADSSKPALVLVLDGQMQSGKNRVLITRTGHRYPPKRFAEWRDRVVAEIQRQNTGQFFFQSPARAMVIYVPGDKRKRDVPGIVDALFHCLERAGVVKDDALLEDISFVTLDVDRKAPNLTIQIQGKQ